MLETCIVVVAVLLGVLVGAALPVLSQLRRTLKAAENTMLQSGTKLDRVLEHVSEATSRINRISTEVETAAGHLKGVFELLEGLGDLAARLSDKVRIVVKNELPESTAIHFHGLLTPNSMDGVPDITQEPIKPGASFTYEFVAKGPAVGMYHSHQNAVVQVPNGLAGAFLVGQVPTPGVNITQEIPMMLNDAGTIGLSLNGKSFPATAPIAVKPGENVLVHYLNEGVMAHPMHLHGMNQKVVAKDGIPLQFPYDADTINVAPGERYTVLITASEPGVWAWHCHILPHAEREDGMFGMVTAMIVK